MLSSGMLRRVALGRTDVSEELRDFIIRVIRVGEPGTTRAVTATGCEFSVALFLARHFL
jgi:hypothetical protein